MKILIIGSGGREHALTWKIALSPLVTQLFVCPGNPGTAQEKKTKNVPIAATDLPALLEFAKNNSIDLTVVGPETPLCLGIVDLFQAHGLRIVGPSKKAAQLEGSKAYCKAFLTRHGIPTAHHAIFSETSTALSYLSNCTMPIVIKADGLANGKGVIIAQSHEEASQTIKNILNEKQFGAAGKQLVVEDFLVGEECSCILLLDQQTGVRFADSQDHKRRFENEQGPNTGGMGAYSPVPQLNRTIQQKIDQRIVAPVIRGLKKDGLAYCGFLYIGLMISPTGDPYVLEFNVRLGDPETQALLMRLESDLLSLLVASLNNQLQNQTIQWSDDHTCTVVLTDRAYPNATEAKKEKIVGLNTPPPQGVQVFHSNTELSPRGDILACEGRVLSVTARAPTLEAAAQRAYAHASTIHWPSSDYRRDIGHRALSVHPDSIRPLKTH